MSERYKIAVAPLFYIFVVSGFIIFGMLEKWNNRIYNLTEK
jgi:hypothetical protein